MEDAPTPPAATPDWERIDEDIRCPLCEYNLRMLTAPRCPECGYRFEWDALLDPSRRKHPYIFEHHPESNLWSFRRTLLNGLRPRRFWTSLHPAQPSSAHRLVLYWCVAAVVYSVPVASKLGVQVAGVVQVVSANRAAALVRIQSPGARNYRSYVIQEFGSVAAWLDWNYPKPDSAAAIWRLASATAIPLAATVFLLLPLAHPWVTVLVLLIFRVSMRRARIRPVHVLRCVLYTVDLQVWMGLFLALAIVASRVTSGAPLVNTSLVYGVSAFGVVLGLCAVYRVYVAYRYYLRFDHPFATVVASQLIVLLVYANLIGPWLV